MQRIKHLVEQGGLYPYPETKHHKRIAVVSWIALATAAFTLLLVILVDHLI